MGYQKLYIGITWFSDSVETGIFVAEHEGWVKKGCKFVKKKLITCIIRLEHALKS